MLSLWVLMSPSVQFEAWFFSFQPFTLSNIAITRLSFWIWLVSASYLPNVRRPGIPSACFSYICFCCVRLWSDRLQGTLYRRTLRLVLLVARGPRVCGVTITGEAAELYLCKTCSTSSLCPCELSVSKSDLVVSCALRGWQTRSSWKLSPVSYASQSSQDQWKQPSSRGKWKEVSNVVGELESFA